jgi:hypothetical protein
MAILTTWRDIYHDGHVHVYVTYVMPILEIIVTCIFYVCGYYARKHEHISVELFVYY